MSNSNIRFRCMAIAAILAACGAASADQIMEIWEIPTLGGVGSDAFDVNNSGQVVGFARNADGQRMPVLFEPGVGLTSLADGLTTNGIAWTINNHGQIGGWYTPLGAANPHGFLWDNGEMMLLYGPNGPDGGWSEVMGINDQGQMIGSAAVPGPDGARAFIWEPGQSHPVVELPQIDGSGASWYAGHRINNHGQTTGFYQSNNPGWPWRAYTYDGVSSYDIGSLGDDPSNYAEAWGINDAGKIVGYADIVTDVVIHAFLYDGDSMMDLGTLGGGYSFAWDINNLDWVVGHAANADGDVRAFLWRDGVMEDLNSMLPDGSGWVLTNAIAVSDTGYIAGTGLFDGQTRGYVLYIPAPGTALLLAAPCLGALRRRR